MSVAGNLRRDQPAERVRLHPEDLPVAGRHLWQSAGWLWRNAAMWQLQRRSGVRERHLPAELLADAASDRVRRQVRHGQQRLRRHVCLRWLQRSGSMPEQPVRLRGHSQSHGVCRSQLRTGRERLRGKLRLRRLSEPALVQRCRRLRVQPVECPMRWQTVRHCPGWLRRRGQLWSQQRRLSGGQLHLRSGRRNLHVQSHFAGNRLRRSGRLQRTGHRTQRLRRQLHLRELQLAAALLRAGSVHGAKSAVSVIRTLA